MQDTKQPLLNFRPAFSVAIIFMLSILLPPIYLLSNVIFYVIGLVVVVALTVVLCLIRYKTHKKVAIAVMIISLLFIAFSNVAILARINYNKNANFVGEAYITGYVTDVTKKESTKGGYEYKIVVEGEIDGNTEKIYATVFSKEDIHVYKNVKMLAKVKRFELVYDGKINYFPLTDNIRYISTDTTLYDAYEIKQGVIPAIRYKILDTLKTYTPNSYEISYALLTGETSLIEYGELSSYRNVGIAHIFAVSGLHIGFLYTAISLILKLFKVKNKYAIFIITPILFLYVAICGFTASCLRAFSIITIHMLTTKLGYKYDALTAISLSVIMVLLISPLSMFSIGFQLSYLAYGGIVLFNYQFTELLSKFLPNKFAKFISPFIIAVLATTPVSVDAVGYLSPLTIILNIIIVPIIGVIYVITLITCLLLMISPVFKILAVLPEGIFVTLSNIATTINSSAFIIRNLSFSIAKTFYYSAFIITLDKFNITYKERLILFITLISLFILTFIGLNVSLIS